LHFYTIANFEVSLFKISEEKVHNFTLNSYNMLVFKTLFVYFFAVEIVVGEAVHNCDGSKRCPAGYRCCGPISLKKGGICYKGATGICPL
jgi:hypothetical protein